MRRALSITAAVLLIAGLCGCAPGPQLSSIQIEQQLTNLLELHTYEHVYRDVVYFGEDRSFLGIKTGETRVLFSINIGVRAGVDLQKGFSIRADTRDPTRVYVQLPAAEILSVDADESSIREYFLEDPRGNIGLLDLTTELSEVKAEIATDAIERGILGRAQANARQIVTSFLSVAGFASIEFAPPQRPDNEVQG